MKKQTEILKECIVNSQSNYNTDSATKFSLVHSNEKGIEDAVHIEVHTVIPYIDLLEQYQKNGYTIFMEENTLIGKKCFLIKVDTLLKGIDGLGVNNKKP